jgi:ABC-type transport system involved in multi-copper enzyme maturation permease subunit
VAVGLLLLSVSAATTLAEERDRGSLDVIMTTPLTSREIVWGKWWGTFAMIPRLLILPIWGAAGAAMVTDGWIGLLLMIGLILAYSAAIASLGLALATWIPRLGRAITASVLAYVVVALGWPLLLQVLPGLPAFPRNGYPMQPTWDGLGLASPFFGIYATTEWATRWPYSSGFSALGPALAHYDPSWPVIWIAVYAAIAWVLAQATLWTFDRCLGRIPESHQGSARYQPVSAARRGIEVTQ